MKGEPHAEQDHEQGGEKFKREHSQSRQQERSCDDGRDRPTQADFFPGHGPYPVERVKGISAGGPEPHRNLGPRLTPSKVVTWPNSKAGIASLRRAELRNRKEISAGRALLRLRLLSGTHQSAIGPDWKALETAKWQAPAPKRRVSAFHAAALN